MGVIRVISDWYTLNCSKSRMYRIQFVDPVGYDKLVRNVRICTGLKIILLLLILAGISVGIYYIWAAHAQAPGNGDAKNATRQEGSLKVKEGSAEGSNMTSTSTVATPTKEALTSTSEPGAGDEKLQARGARASIAPFISTNTSTFDDDAASKNNVLTTPTTASAEMLADPYTSTSPDDFDKDKTAISSTPTYDPLQRAAEIRQMLIHIRENGLIVTDGENANCSIIEKEICLYNSSSSSKSARNSSENISEGFVVVRNNDVWKIYCGTWEIFDRLAPRICSNSGWSVLRVPLIELEAKGVNMHTFHNPTENEISDTENASRECDGAGYVIC